jgi:hypothetical protein
MVRKNAGGSVTVKRQSISKWSRAGARSGTLLVALGLATALAGCSSLEMPQLRWPFAAKPVPLPEAVDEIVFESPDAGGPVNAFPQYFRRNTLIIDLTAASGAGSVLMRPKTAAGWPVRVAFRVKPGSFEALEISAAQRVLLPVVASAKRPTLDLELPPSFVRARGDDALRLRWGAVAPPAVAPPAVAAPPVETPPVVAPAVEPPASDQSPPTS